MEMDIEVYEELKQRFLQNKPLTFEEQQTLFKLEEIYKQWIVEQDAYENSPAAIKGKSLAAQTISITEYRSERNLMQYPFCTIARNKRTKSIEYRSSDGRRWLTVSANQEYGIAKIWDFDILIFALSKASEIHHHLSKQYFPSYIEFTAYECLKALNKPIGGTSVKWLREALRRLASTTYVGNVFTEKTNVETGFTLITYEYVEARRGGYDQVRIYFDKRIVQSARKRDFILALNQEAVVEESGLRKRLLQLIQVSLGDKNPFWKVGLEHLKNMCAYEDKTKAFKHNLKTLHLPWPIKFEKAALAGDNVIFFRSKSTENYSPKILSCDD